MTASKLPQGGVGGIAALPEWPADLLSGAEACDEMQWLNESLTAALARMEALVEWAEHNSDCALWVYPSDDRPWLRSAGDCTCGLSELLAACERKQQHN